MINRLADPKFDFKLAKQFPVITITGPRQSGKTTLARKLFPKKPYVNLELPDVRQLALDDPRAFLSDLPDGAVLDEIQRVPQLPSYIQGIVDNQKRNNLFILTGSQQFEISQSISQSLAGRTALIKLLPFSFKELGKYLKPNRPDVLLLKGAYPRTYNKGLSPGDFYSNYFETYVQRDLRQLSQIDNLITFEKCVRLLAGRTGQLLNYSSLANDLGVSQPTIRNWISLMEASYIVYLMPPFFKNIRKRLIKTPKVYFYDTGLVSWLLGIENLSQIRSHPLRGNLFENFIVTELLKWGFNRAKNINLHFYRDRTGNEVDVVIEQAMNYSIVEIKSASTFHSSILTGLHSFERAVSDKPAKKMLVYTGDHSPVHQKTRILPWNNLKPLFNML